MIDIQKKKAMRNIILLQCAGAPAAILFTNGFILSYLSVLGFSSSLILKLLTLPTLLCLLILLPAAFMSDRYGKKIIGSFGLLATIAGFLLITLAGSSTDIVAKQIVVTGIVIFGIGRAMFSSNWFALLSPIIPENIRGHFFARLRISWQSVGILLTLIASVLLHNHLSVKTFQLLLIFVSVFLTIRMLIYLQIPEIEKYRPSQKSLISSFRKIIVIPNFIPFCSYIFLISISTGACPWIFSLMEKDILHFSDDIIVYMGTLLLVGSVGGFFLGGKMVDHLGTKYVFLICHFSFGIILFLFLFREWFAIPLIVTIGIFTILFGIIYAASGIAITSELLAIIPPENKSLSTALAIMLQSGGIALSGLIFSKAIDLHILSDSWILFGRSMSEYDAILCSCGIAIIMLSVTLGLVPSIINKAGWIPQSG